MAIYTLRDRQGVTWAFDPDVIYSIIRGAVRAQLIRNRSRVVENNPGWLLPTTYNLETNWQGFRAELDSESERYWQNAEMQLRTSTETMRNNLIGLVSNATSDLAWYRNESRSVSQRSSANINRVVSNWETALTVATTVRDGSATFLIVTSGLVSGGAGFAAAGALGMTGISTGTAMTTLAVGSVMRGAFTWQDTGNVGSAMVNAIGSFSVGAIGIGAAGTTMAGVSQMTRAEQATILVISSAGQGATSGLQALAEGKNIRAAAAQAGVSALSQALGGLAGNRFEKLGFIAQAAIGTAIDLAGNAASNAAGDRFQNPPTIPRPTTAGTVDFAGLPVSEAEAWVTRYALARVR